jgi:cobyrinic acid a,c-diamide synthase
VQTVPTLVIAGTHSGVGKTSVATAVIAALTRRGLKVQPFKIGPDFIDPSFHRAAAGRACRNLDGWMLDRDTNLRLFARASEGADIAVVEGVMGLFDGHDGRTEAGSTAEMAKWLGAPVALVADGAALARSAGALVLGFETFDPDVDVAGVLFNRVGGPGHFAYLRDALAGRCRSAPIGWLKLDLEIALPDRHLGLVMADEILTPARLDRLIAWLEANVDVDRLVQLARGRRPLRIDVPSTSAPAPAPAARIGLARDRAFSFYYEDNLDLLRRSGAELVALSPIADARLPEGLDGLYLGGGYPELHAAALAANASMRSDIAALARSGAPVYAECGGFMYLTEAIVDSSGRAFEMAGVFPTRARMQDSLAALAYVEVEAAGAGLYLPPGRSARGHEFRWSAIDPMPEGVERCYRVKSTCGERADGYRMGSTLASYVHLHFESCPDFAARFVAACRRRKDHR